MISPTKLTPILLPVLLCVQTSHQDTIETLIQKLGSPRFQERDAATERLLKRCPEAIPALKKALRSSDAETAKRAALILERYGQRSLADSLKRLKCFVKQGKIDLAVEMLARWPKEMYDKECWQVARNLATKLSELHKKQDRCVGTDLKQNSNSSPMILNTNLMTKHTKGATRRTSYLFARVEEVRMDRLSRVLLSALVFAHGNVEVYQTGPIGIFAGDSIYIDSPHSTLIVADGNVVMGRDGAYNCVIIARGNITFKSIVSDCVVISGKSVEYDPKIVINSKILQNVAKPLGYIQFFDPTREGITVAQATGGVRVTKVTAGKPFHKAGLQKGDLITADHSAGRKADVTSPEVFRRLLRRHFAWQEEMTFHLRRDGKSLTIRVPRPE